MDKYIQQRKIKKKGGFDEIELAILIDEQNAPVKIKLDDEENEEIEPEYDGTYIRRRALIDQMLMENSNF